MNSSFNIQYPGIDTANSTLCIEAGPMQFSFVIADANNCFLALVIYPFPAGLNASGIAEKISIILQQEIYLQKEFKKTSIVWTFSESILVPHAFHDTEVNDEMLRLVYGDNNGELVKSDFMYQHNIHNIYRVPERVINALPASLQYTIHTHQYSLLPGMVSNTGNRMQVQFYNNHVTLFLCKSGHIQLMKRFEYQCAEDAVYHLLNVCESFDVQAEEVILHISGMIDRNSKLYEGLYNYFLNIEFQPYPENAAYSDAIKKYPEHFFSQLFAQALCV